MHRRQFIRAATAGLLLPSGSVIAGQRALPSASPQATPQHHGRPRPIVLGDGIELIDFRIYPSEDVPRIIGEISSTRDDMVDAPVVSITFPDLGNAGLAYAPPVLPVMRPGESNMIFGILPKGIDTDEKLLSAVFALCEHATAGRNTALNAPHEWKFTDIHEDKRPGLQHLTGNVLNGGSTFAISPVVQGLIRDGDERYVGTTARLPLGSMHAGTARPFSVWATATAGNPANPYIFLGESLSYRTTLKGAIVGFVTQPGCPSLFGLT